MGHVALASLAIWTRLNSTHSGERADPRNAWQGRSRPSVYFGYLMTRVDLYRLVDDLPDDTVDDTALVLKMIMRRQLDPAQT